MDREAQLLVTPGSRMQGSRAEREGAFGLV
jgi:hypothetical protein